MYIHTPTEACAAEAVGGGCAGPGAVSGGDPRRPGEANPSGRPTLAFPGCGPGASSPGSTRRAGPARLPHTRCAPDLNRTHRTDPQRNSRALLVFLTTLSKPVSKPLRPLGQAVALPRSSAPAVPLAQAGPELTPRGPGCFYLLLASPRSPAAELGALLPAAPLPVRPGPARPQGLLRRGRGPGRRRPLCGSVRDRPVRATRCSYYTW